MKTVAKVSLTTLALLAAISTYAEEPEFEDGVYISGLLGAGWGDADWSGSNTVTGYDEYSQVNATETSKPYEYGDNEARLVGSIAFGYQLIFDYFYIGAEVAGTFGGARDFESNDSNSYHYAVETSDDPITVHSGNYSKASLRGSEIDLDLKPGFLLDENLLVYARIGAAFNELQLQNSSEWSLKDADGWDYPSVTDYSSESKNVVGLRVGAGVEYLISEQIGISLDYVHTNYGSIETSTSGHESFLSTDGWNSSISGNANTEVSVSTNTLMAGVTYHF